MQETIEEAKNTIPPKKSDLRTQITREAVSTSVVDLTSAPALSAKSAPPKQKKKPTNEISVRYANR